MRYHGLLLAGLAALSGCMTAGSDPQRGMTALQAEAVGEMEVASVPTTAGAALLSAMNGGLIGGAIGSGLDDGDRRRGLAAEYQALEYTPSGQLVTWRNDSAGRYGEVVAAQPYRVGSQDCRQYNHTVFVDSRPQSARGTACRNSDGSWTPLT